MAVGEYERWVREHHGDVYRTARRIVGDEGDALDVAQQVFLAALEQRDRLAAADDAGRVLRWLAAKTALQHLRGREARTRRERRIAMERPDATPADDPAAREEIRLVGRLLAALPDDLRHAVVLRFHEALTYERTRPVNPIWFGRLADAPMRSFRSRRIAWPPSPAGPKSARPPTTSGWSCSRTSTRAA